MLLLKSEKKGKVLYEDGTIYEGERQKGRRNGKGKLILPNRKGIYDG
jgi:hypothetical protein